MRALFALAIVVSATGIAAAQFRASVDVVRVEALVTEGGRPVGGLTAADFRLTDNGAVQAIAVRSLAEAEIDVIVALDTSLSVRGRRLEHLRAAMTTLMERLRGHDRATLIAFNHHLTIGPVDATPETVRAQLTTLDAAGATSLVDATTAALVWAAGHGRPMLVLVCSDGRDTASWTRGEQALDLAQRSDAVVDAVVSGAMPARGSWLPRVDGRQHGPATERFLFALTDVTGGEVLNGDASGGLAAAFGRSLAQFRTRYEITYTLAMPTRGWHAIEIDVPGRRGVTVRARRGYRR